MKLLKHETDFIGAVARQFAFAQIADLQAVDRHAARARMIEPAENINQRRFTGAGGTHDGDPLARFHFETHVVERADFSEALFELLDLDQRRHPSPRKISAGRTRPRRRRGNAPASATPTVNAMVIGKTSRRAEITTPKMRPPIHLASTTPNKNPSTPPTAPSVPASARNNRMMRGTVPPSAFISPTSRRRSMARAAIDARMPNIERTRISAMVQKISPRILPRIFPSAAAI